MQSGLVRDIPLDAWVSFLADPNNPFKKSIAVENPDSSLSVMKTHSELEVPTEQLPEGILTILEAVIPHIKDPELRASVRQQLTEFREDQQTKHDRAVNIATRWRDFEVQLVGWYAQYPDADAMMSRALDFRRSKLPSFASR